MKVYIVWYITTGYENTIQIIFKNKETAEKYIVTQRDPQNYYISETDVNE